MNTHPREEGSASVEVAVLTPLLLAVLVVVIAAGRVVTAHHALEHAATTAARAASLARTPSGAHSAATSTGLQVLGEQHLACTDLTQDLDTSGLATRAGTTGVVTVGLRCSVSLADLTGLSGLPGGIPLRAEFSSPVDPFRGRT